MKRHRPHFVLLIFFALLLVVVDAFAGPHVLRAGREKDVIGLFAPYGLGSKVVGEWKLWSVSIERRQVVVGLRDPKGREERFTLVHPLEEQKDVERSQSFMLDSSGVRDPVGEKAIGRLFESIKKNDTGGFWEMPQNDTDDSDKPPGEVPPAPPKPSAAIAYSSLVVDGIVGILLIWALAALLAVRLLRDAPKWMRIALPTIVLAGLVVRLELAQPALLGAWPWSRVWPNVRAVYDGPVLEALASKLGQSFFLTDVMGWTNFAYAGVMPLVLFAHATYLLRDPKAGIAAAFAMAMLPQHIRFSRCEDAFVPSLVLTSLAFALIHAWLRDPSKVVRGLVLAVLPFVLYPGYLLRPLNILFIAVYFAAIIVLHPETAPRNRRIVGLAVVAGVGLLAAPSFVSKNDAALETATASLQWLGHTFGVIARPRLLVLTDVRVTPLVLPVLAIAGAICSWSRGEKRLVLFLCGWLLLFVTTHAFVVEPAMQPRYHLHLVVPFLLLGASGVSYWWSRARVGLIVAGLVLLTAPFMHRAWIRDLHYSEMQEFEFVRKARDIVPDGCTVIEYVGTDVRASELRFLRIGNVLRPHEQRLRYDVIPAFAPGVVGQSEKSVDQILQNPPACLYMYHGLACTTDPAGDACGAYRHRISGQIVQQQDIPIAIYDRRILGSAPPSGTSASLTLYRIDAPSK